MKKLIAIALIAVALPAAPALAAVSLGLTGDGGASGVNIVAGQSFTVTLNLNSTGEAITAVDYLLRINNSGAGLFRIANRDITGSPFSDTFKANTGDNGANAGVLDASVSPLNPTNAMDLGGSISNVSSPLGAGTSLVAQYTLATDANLAPGTYTLSTASLPGTGYEGSAPSFADTAFDQHASFSVTVNPAVTSGVPEPTSVAMIVLGFMALNGRRRRR